MRPITRNGWLFTREWRIIIGFTMMQYIWPGQLPEFSLMFFFFFPMSKLASVQYNALYTYYCIFSQVTIPGIINYTPTRYLPIFFTAHLRGQTPKWWNFLGRGWEATGRRMPGACRDANAGSLQWEARSPRAPHNADLPWFTNLK